MRRNLILLSLAAGMGVQALDWYALRRASAHQGAGGMVDTAYAGVTGRPEIQYGGVGFPKPEVQYGGVGFPKPEVQYGGVGFPTPQPNVQ
jgi:hypothetical protein